MRLSPFHMIPAVLLMAAKLIAQPSELKSVVGFEVNRGQHGPLDTLFVGRQGRMEVAIHQSHAQLALIGERRTDLVTMQFAGANTAPETRGLGRRKDIGHYYLSPTEIYRDVAQFDQIRTTSLYEGIDLLWHARQNLLEYDFVVQPGAEPGAIGITFKGAPVRLDVDELVLDTTAGPIRQKLVAYQEIGGKRVTVPAAYRVSAGSVHFTLGAYDRKRTLIIDPVLLFSSYLGNDAAASDITGIPNTEVLVTCGNIQTSASTRQAVVTRFSTAGNVRAVFGAANRSTSCQKITADGSSLYLAGVTNQPDFARLNSPQAAFGGGQDVLVMTLDATTLSPTLSGTIGGSGFESANGLSFDGTNLYLAGVTSSADFPTTLGSFSPTFNGGGSDGFIYRFSVAGSASPVATLTGGNGEDSLLAIEASTPYSRVCAAGLTNSTNITTGSSAIQASAQGGSDGWLTCLTPDLTTVMYATYYGGSGDDQVTSLFLDGPNYVTMAGRTRSGTLPLASAFQSAPSATPEDGFLVQLQFSAPSLRYGSFLGTPAYGIAAARSIDSEDMAIAGATGLLRFSFISRTPNANAPTLVPGLWPSSATPLSLKRGVDPESQVFGLSSLLAAGSITTGNLPVASNGPAIDISFNPAASLGTEGFALRYCVMCLGVSGDVSIQTAILGPPGVTGSVAGPGGLFCNTTSYCVTSLPRYRVHDLVATAGPGFAFTGWGSPFNNATCQNAQPSLTCRIALQDPILNTAVPAMVAFFTDLGGPPPLTVSFAGTGTGSVSSLPDLIRCPGVCTGTHMNYQLTAKPNPGSTFTGWTNCPAANGNVCSLPGPGTGFPFEPPPGNVIANFNLGSSTGAPSLTVSRFSPLVGGLASRYWPIRISNTGTLAATGALATITGITVSGPQCTPILVAPTTPVTVGSLAPGASMLFDVQLNLASCTSSATRLTLSIQLTADGGYNVTRTLVNLTR